MRVPALRRPALAFAVRAGTSGLAGTAVMTATIHMERRLRSTSDIPADYDSTHRVTTAAATVLRRRPRTKAQAELMFALVHWGYGSAVAGLHTALVARGLPRRRAALVFYATTQTMAFSLFPLLGGTPPPWRWRPDVLASSLIQHAIYVLVVAAVDDAVDTRIASDRLSL